MVAGRHIVGFGGVDVTRPLMQDAPTIEGATHPAMVVHPRAHLVRQLVVFRGSFPISAAAVEESESEDRFEHVPDLATDPGASEDVLAEVYSRLPLTRPLEVVRLIKKNLRSMEHASERFQKVKGSQRCRDPRSNHS